MINSPLQVHPPPPIYDNWTPTKIFPGTANPPVWYKFNLPVNKIRLPRLVALFRMLLDGVIGTTRSTAGVFGVVGTTPKLFVRDGRFETLF